MIVCEVKSLFYIFFRDGACIVVRGQLIAAAFTQQLYNPQCFLQYFDPTVPPPDWHVRLAAMTRGGAGGSHAPRSFILSIVLQYIY